VTHNYTTKRLIFYFLHRISCLRNGWS